MDPGISVDSASVKSYCEKHGIVKLALFGSALRSDFGSDSDVDVLVEFDAARIPTFFELADMELELSGIVGRKVDLRTPGELSPHFRDIVARESVVHYGA